MIKQYADRQGNLPNDQKDVFVLHEFLSRYCVSHPQYAHAKWVVRSGINLSATLPLLQHESSNIRLLLFLSEATHPHCRQQCRPWSHQLQLRSTNRWSSDGCSKEVILCPVETCMLQSWHCCPKHHRRSCHGRPLSGLLHQRLAGAKY